MFVILKPDVILAGQDTHILSWIVDSTGERLQTFSLRQLQLCHAKLLYAEHKEKDFFLPLCEYMINGPVAIVTFSGGPLDRGIVDDIRSQFGTSIRQNAIHASRTVEDEKRERAIFE